MTSRKIRLKDLPGISVWECILHKETKDRETNRSNICLAISPDRGYNEYHGKESAENADLSLPYTDGGMIE